MQAQTLVATNQFGNNPDQTQPAKEDLLLILAELKTVIKETLAVTQQGKAA